MGRRDQLSRFLAVTVTGFVAVTAALAQSGSPAPGAAAGMTLEEARRFFVCRTHMSFDKGHGTQVFYIRPDGTEFLWYPGNSVIVTSKWKFMPRVTSFESSSQYVDLCFQFGTNTYNPVTKQQGGRWECRAAVGVAKSVLEHARGDVFGLARHLPFILSSDRTSIEALQKLLQAPLNETQPDADTNCARGESSLTGELSIAWLGERVHLAYDEPVVLK